MPKSSFLSLMAVITAALIFAGCQRTSPAPSAVPEDSVMMEKEESELMMEEAFMEGENESESEELESENEVSVETSYQTPAGDEKVTFVLSVDEAGMITDAETLIQAKAPISVDRQKKFSEELPTILVGKKLADLSDIDRVGGSSLTTGAFNKALADLKAQL